MSEHQITKPSAPTAETPKRRMRIVMMGADQAPFVVSTLGFSWLMFEPSQGPYGTIVQRGAWPHNVKMLEELRRVLGKLLDEPHVWFVVLAPYAGTCIHIAHSLLTTPGQLLETAKQTLEGSGITITEVRDMTAEITTASPGDTDRCDVLTDMSHAEQPE